jgi:hypothetical protein
MVMNKRDAHRPIIFRINYTSLTFKRALLHVAGSYVVHFRIWKNYTYFTSAVTITTTTATAAAAATTAATNKITLYQFPILHCSSHTRQSETTFLCLIVPNTLHCNGRQNMFFRLR